MTTKEKSSLLSEFAVKAQAALRRKKKGLTKELIVPSLQNEDGTGGIIKIRSLNDSEVTECLSADDEDDRNKSDKYCLYIGIVEPSLKDLAKELKATGVIDTMLEVTDMFDNFEIREVAHEIMKLSGVLSDKKVKVVENLKN